MSNFEENKFIVINRKRIDELRNAKGSKHLEKYCIGAAKHFEDALLMFNNAYEDFVNKKLDQKYFVCNQDEPYAQEVIDCILNNGGESKNKVKADAVNEFVSLMIGAFDTGFVDKNNPTLAEIHQVARNHVKDNYRVDLPSIVEQWGKETAKECGLQGIDLKGDI
jgi:hypothetical protein